MESPSLPQPLRPSPWRNEFLPATAPGALRLSADAAVNTSLLCSKCRPIQSWLQANWSTLKFVNQEFEQSINHYDNSLQLERSYLAGCHLCTLFWHSLDPITSSSPHVRIAEREEILKKVPNGKHVKIIAYNKGTTGPVLQLTLELPQNEIISGEHIRLRCRYLTNDHHGPNFEIPSFLAPSASISSKSVSTMSQATMCLAKEWIAECTRSHAECWKGKPSRLPTRLLDVRPAGQNEQVQVVATHSFSNGIQYAALSYRWGVGPMFQLTSSTSEHFNSGVAIQSLPKTIQDAVNFTRNIGLQWLWVDSLCIMQDSKDDWNRQASAMCDVYQNSFITIAALGASSSNDGLFALRDPLIYTPCGLFQTGASETICADQPTIYSPALGLGTWPLHQRWVTQERILPPRALNFGPYLVWQCRKETWDEYDIGLHSVYDSGFTLNRQFFRLVLDGRLHSMSWAERDEMILQIWRGILGSFSEASLTVRTDRLVAISGIIAAIQRRTGWKNLAGLWEPFLLGELLWQKGFENPGQPTGLKPIWSWVAIDGGISWPGDEPAEGYYLNPLAHVKEAESVIPIDINGVGCKEMRIALSGVMHSRKDKQNIHPQGNEIYETRCRPGRLALDWGGILGARFPFNNDISTIVPAACSRRLGR